MADITIKGLTFEPYISREEIAKQVKRIAAEIKRDCVTEYPVFVCVLNGAFMFAADLYRALDMPQSEITFIRFKSYDGTHSSGEMKQVMGLAENIAGREVIIIEDIVDTGFTALELRKTLEALDPISVKMAALLYKPNSQKCGKKPEYVGFEIPSKFILGYGLDLDGQARGLSDIYVLKEEDKHDNQNHKTMLNIVIFGAPGSGKGTQSENLIEHYKLFHISTGDVLRDHIRRGTELGKTAKEYIDQGQLIPDELMIGILAQVIDDNKEAAANGVIFDGFPRTIPQAEALETLLNERGTSVSAVVGLEVPEQELIDRLVKRGQMSGRSDDNEETIKKRLDVYHNQTSPLQEFYKDKGLYRAIKGIGTIEGIFEDIKAAIDEINA